jgi:hypothetical protein
MSSQDTRSELNDQEIIGDSVEREDDAVANKLSKELNNWRRRRTNGRQRRSDSESVKYHSDSARTIKLRGHETLVVRKPKLAKPVS